jgi:hypothetical protein
LIEQIIFFVVVSRIQVGFVGGGGSGIVFGRRRSFVVGAEVGLFVFETEGFEEFAEGAGGGHGGFG